MQNKTKHTTAMIKFRISDDINLLVTSALVGSVPPVSFVSFAIFKVFCADEKLTAPNETPRFRNNGLDFASKCVLYLLLNEQKANFDQWDRG